MKTTMMMLVELVIIAVAVTSIALLVAAVEL